jgi:hypothetical protein
MTPQQRRERLRGLRTRLHTAIQRLEYYSALIPTPQVKRNITIHERNLRGIARDLLTLMQRPVSRKERT